MNVYTYFSPDGPDLDAQLVPLWEESWRRQGWTPRVLTIRDARKHFSYREEGRPERYAWAHVGGGWYSPVSILNIYFRPKKLRTPFEIFFGGVLWATKKGSIESLQRPINTKLVSEFGNESIFPLVSFSNCKSVEEVQRGIDSCLQARKKN